MCYPGLRSGKYKILFAYFTYILLMFYLPLVTGDRCLCYDYPVKI